MGLPIQAHSPDPSLAGFDFFLPSFTLCFCILRRSFEGSGEQTANEYTEQIQVSGLLG